MASKQMDDFHRFWKHIPWKTQDELLIILKGHLLIEDLLKGFCEGKMAQPQFLNDAKLSFATSMLLTRALSRSEGAEWMWTAIAKINSMRNMLAHNLEPKKYELTRRDFISLVQAENGKDLFETFKEPFEHTGVAIFMTYSTLSAHLRIVADGSRPILASLLLEESKQTK